MHHSRSRFIGPFVHAACCALTLSITGSSIAAQAPRTAEDSARAIHLLNRATFGVRPQEITDVLAVGRDAWLERQLHPDRIRDTLAASIQRRYPATTLSMAEMYRQYAPPVRPKVADDKMAAGDTAMMQETAKKQRDKGLSPQALLADLAAAKLERSVRSERQLEEVMTDFWFNHFNVFFQKGADRYLIADYERTAIRPNVFGRFEDLLRATSQHPAMLFYLDNWQSVHVDSTLRARIAPNAQQKGQVRGLNENYARELLELHTLGVDGGYTQKDVVEVARALTGWTFNQPRAAQAAAAQVAQAGARRRGARAQQSDDVEFIFREAFHDRGEKVVLGHRLARGRGIEDGTDVLHIVATHPSTARFISTKLVEYFVTDDAAPALVDRLTAVFTKTNGDLREVTRTLFSDPAFYAAENRRAKVKTPFQLVASTFRATDAQLMNPRGAVQVLKTMGQVPYMASPPTGYPAMSEDWVNSGAMLARMNFGMDYAAGKVPGARPDPKAVLRGDGTAPLRTASRALLPGVDASTLEKAIVADVGAQQADATARAKTIRMLGLILGSPEFQRH